VPRKVFKLKGTVKEKDVATDRERSRGDDDNAKRSSPATPSLNVWKVSFFLEPLRIPEAHTSFHISRLRL
jgi:hypothetical protein